MNSRLEDITGALNSTTDLARAVLIHGPISRGELAEYLGLSLPTLTRISRPLIDSGLIYEVDDLAQSTAGRPSKPLAVRAEAGYYIGIKLTGNAAIGVLTNVRADELVHLELSLDDRRVTSVHRVIVRLCQQLVDQAGDAARVLAVGISVGGYVREDNTIGYAPFLGWEEVDLAGPLSAELGVPVFMENDVVAVTAAEHWFGLGRGRHNFAVVTIGAGIGYGLVRRDQVVTIRDARIGIGVHMLLDPSGPVCIQGCTGCAAAFLTIPNIESQAASHYGRAISFEELIALAKAEDSFALNLVRRSGAAFGKLICLIAAIAMVDTFVLAGEGIDIYRLAGDQVWDSIHQERGPELLPLQLLADEGNFVAWARGAAAIAIQHSFERLLVS